eukprot:869838-Amphidinium_carterae.1
MVGVASPVFMALGSFDLRNARSGVTAAANKLGGLEADCSLIRSVIGEGPNPVMRQPFLQCCRGLLSTSLTGHALAVRRARPAGSNLVALTKPYARHRPIAVGEHGVGAVGGAECMVHLTDNGCSGHLSTMTTFWC